MMDSLALPGRSSLVALAVLFPVAALVPVDGYSQERQQTLTNTQAHSHDGDLHFSHPLIAESPSPDTKMRLDYHFRDFDSEAEHSKEMALRFEGEYALDRSFSIEVNFPWTRLDQEGESGVTNLGNVEVGVKFANFAFEERGLLLGYGIEFGLPTGNDDKGIGTDHIVEIEPFLNLGHKRGDLEVVAFASFGIPANQDPGEPVETELGHNLSVLYHINPRFSGLLELDGYTVLSGDEDATSVVNITPGVKSRPLADSDFQFGAAVSFPLSQVEEFHVQAQLSLFYHY